MILETFLFLTCSFIVTFFTVPILIEFANETDLYTDINNRTSHTHKVPSLGGIAIFLGISFSTLLLTPNTEFHKLQYLLTTQFLIFFLGLKDDIFVLSARKKLLVQVICSLLLIFFAHTKITSFYGVLGVEELGTVQSTIFSVFVIVGLVNAFNLIDGINWLAGLLCISSASFLGLWFGINGFVVEFGVTLALIGSTLAFLYYNKSPAKIFMGDTGSLLLGLTLTYLMIKFINYNHTTPNLTLELRSAPAMAISLMFVPIIDTLRVIFIRLKERKSPFTPDRNHLHHILVDAGNSHMKSSTILFLTNTFCIVISFLLNKYTGRVTIPTVFLACYAIISVFSFRSIKKKAQINLSLN